MEQDFSDACREWREIHGTEINVEQAQHFFKWGAICLHDRIVQPETIWRRFMLDEEWGGADATNQQEEE